MVISFAQIPRCTCNYRTLCGPALPIVGVFVGYPPGNSLSTRTLPALCSRKWWLRRLPTSSFCCLHLCVNDLLFDCSQCLFLRAVESRAFETEMSQQFFSFLVAFKRKPSITYPNNEQDSFWPIHNYYYVYPHPPWNSWTMYSPTFTWNMYLLYPPTPALETCLPTLTVNTTDSTYPPTL